MIIPRYRQWNSIFVEYPVVENNHNTNYDTFIRIELFHDNPTADCFWYDDTFTYLFPSVIQPNGVLFFYNRFAVHWYWNPVL